MLTHCGQVICVAAWNRVTCSITKGVTELVSVYMTVLTICPDMTKTILGDIYVCVYIYKYLHIMKNQFKVLSEISLGLYEIV